MRSPWIFTRILYFGRTKIKIKSSAYLGRIALEYHAPHLHDGRSTVELSVVLFRRIFINEIMQTVHFTIASIMIISRIHRRRILSALDYFTVWSKSDIHSITSVCFTEDRWRKGCTCILYYDDAFLRLFNELKAFCALSRPICWRATRRFRAVRDKASRPSFPSNSPTRLRHSNKASLSLEW